MKFWTLWLRVVLLAGILLAARVALAAPVTCSYGYQDSTCGTNLYNAPQAAPTCPGTAGWTIVVPAKWIGSTFSPPQCNYTPPPACPNGFTQTAAPAWNGSSWVGLACSSPPAPPQSTDPASQCQATATPQGYRATSGVTGPTAMNPQMSVVAQVVGLTNYASDSVYTWSAQGPMFTSACGVTGTNYVIACLVHPNGQINGLIPQYVTGSSGSCNH
ncbi:hypothetical protein SAMN05444172_9366 [Burkholderia sp. GAS332]|nr:hypothetical protein SAMN05444172_9366 [Burkholderia sp. GAS332]